MLEYIHFILSTVPSNLDRQTLKTILLAIFYSIGILEIGSGIYLMIKEENVWINTHKDNLY